MGVAAAVKRKIKNQENALEMKRKGQLSEGNCGIKITTKIQEIALRKEEIEKKKEKIFLYLVPKVRACRQWSEPNRVIAVVQEWAGQMTRARQRRHSQRPRA